MFKYDKYHNKRYFCLLYLQYEIKINLTPDNYENYN